MCCCDNPPTVYSEVVRTARKVHRCCECLAAIDPGDSYQDARGKWEGEFSRYKTCLPCVQWRTRLAAESDGCWAFGELLDSMPWQDDPAALRWLDDRRKRYEMIRRNRLNAARDAVFESLYYGE